MKRAALKATYVNFVGIFPVAERIMEKSLTIGMRLKKKKTITLVVFIEGYLQGHFAMSGDVLVVTTGWGVCATGIYWVEARNNLSILQLAPYNKRIIQPPMPIVLRLRNSANHFCF